MAYLRTVLAWYTYYLGGHRVVPDDRGPSAGPARPAPEPRRTGGPRPAAAPSPTKAPAATRPTALSASPSPRPRDTAPADGHEPAQPLLSLPDVLPPGYGLQPGVGLLPGGSSGLTSNGTDSMDAGPSTIPDTGR